MISTILVTDFADLENFWFTLWPPAPVENNKILLGRLKTEKVNKEENVEKESVQPEEVAEIVMTEESAINLKKMQKMLKKFLLEMQILMLMKPPKIKLSILVVKKPKLLRQKILLFSQL